MKLRSIANTVAISTGTSFIAFFILYTLFARMFSEYVRLNLDNYLMLTIILFAMLSISVATTLLASIWTTDKMDRSAVNNAILLAFLTNIIFLIAISYTLLYIQYPSIFKNVEGIEYITVIPSVVLLFSIYILGHPMNVVVMSIFTYNVYFILYMLRLGVE